MVQTSIDWASSYTPNCRVMRVDESTWADESRVEGAVDASVNKDRSGHLMESGSLSVDAETGGEEPAFWGRIELVAEQDGTIEVQPIATLRFEPGETVDANGRVKQDMDGYSVLAWADDRLFEADVNVFKGTDGAAKAAEWLSACTPAPVDAQGSFALSDHVAITAGTSYLEAAWTLVDAAGWCIRIGEDGTVTVMPMPSEPSLVIDGSSIGLIESSVTTEGAAEPLPNRYIAVDGEQVAIADRTDDENGRKHYIDVYDQSPQRVDGETLQAYAERRLDEETSVVGRKSYTRGWVPGIVLFDKVCGYLPQANLDCDMRVLTQSINPFAPTAMTETLEVIA